MNNMHCLSNYTPITHCSSEGDTDESSRCTRWNEDNCYTRHLTETRLSFSPNAGCIYGRWGKMTPSEAIRSPRFIWGCFISSPHCWARGPSHAASSVTAASATAGHLSLCCPSRLASLRKAESIFLSATRWQQMQTRHYGSDNLSHWEEIAP